MKLYKIALTMLLAACMIVPFSSCGDRLDLENPNQQTTESFGTNELEEVVIGAYKRIRMEGTFARVGYTTDLTMGDEVWNSSQVWYMEADDYDAPVTNDIFWWMFRDWFYTINACNFGITKLGADDSALTEAQQRIKGQLLFLRGLSYYTLVGYYQTVPLITDYNEYASMDGLYGTSASQDSIMDQVEADFSEAMTLLPSRDAGGEWAKGRATCGAAAGYYARALMYRHKYSEALTVLRNIINGQYGTYRLMANYGDNFREGSAYENNDESLFEVQFMDYGTQGTDDEWTPVNTSSNASQGNAVESNFAPGDVGGWADLSASPWLYNLFKAERTTDGHLDPRLYWTIGTYESDWDNNDQTLGNVCYTERMTTDKMVVTNNNYGGLPIAKWTNMRTGLYNSVTTGLKCGINLRMMRYSDVLLRAAECENEVNGPTQQAIDWINQVRERAGLRDLQLSNFAGNADKLFEQIANVERPKEFGCEYGRNMDLQRWGFYVNDARQAQLKDHETFYRLANSNYALEKSADNKVLKTVPEFETLEKQALSYSDVATAADSLNIKCSFDQYVQGHEYIPIVQALTNKNPNLSGNSANSSTSNASYFSSKGWTVHPVVNLGN